MVVVINEVVVSNDATFSHKFDLIKNIVTQEIVIAIDPKPAVDKIIFFDGNCPMCHSWVKNIIRWDRNKRFRFAPLEGNEAKKLLLPFLPGYLEENTILYFEDGKVFKRSDAILRICKGLGFPYTFLAAGAMIPTWIRDGLYSYIAARRYRYGKRYDSCPMPPIEWQDRFLS